MGGGGCGTIVLIVVVLAVIMALTSNPGQNVQQPGGNFVGQVPQTTTVRTPLDAGEARTLGPMYTDNLGWIQIPSQLTSGLNNFFEATGVRPHVYITDEIPGSEGLTLAQLPAFLERELPSFAEALYNRLFQDEAHFLLVFFEFHVDNDFLWRMYAVPGYRAQTIMNLEAVDILTAYIQHFYVQPGITPETLFSNAFDRTATRIMAQPTDNRIVWVTLILIGGTIVIIIMLFTWWRRRTAQKNLEAEQTERILSQQLDTFGTDDEASRRAKEYE